MRKSTRDSLTTEKIKVFKNSKYVLINGIAMPRKRAKKNFNDEYLEVLKKETQARKKVQNTKIFRIRAEKAAMISFISKIGFTPCHFKDGKWSVEMIYLSLNWEKMSKCF